jgi:hypothetical protein
MPAAATLRVSGDPRRTEEPMRSGQECAQLMRHAIDVVCHASIVGWVALSSEQLPSSSSFDPTNEA